MDIILQVCYIGFCLLLAYYNAMLIKQGRRILHALNAVGHLLLWAAVYLISKDLVLLAILPFIGRLFFDVALNLFRGLDLSYVPDDPRSVIDSAEKLFFDDDGFTPKIIYAFAILMLNVINALI